MPAGDGKLWCRCAGWPTSASEVAEFVSRAGSRDGDGESQVLAPLMLLRSGMGCGRVADESARNRGIRRMGGRRLAGFGGATQSTMAAQARHRRFTASVVSVVGLALIG